VHVDNLAQKVESVLGKSPKPIFEMASSSKGLRIWLFRERDGYKVKPVVARGKTSKWVGDSILLPALVGGRKKDSGMRASLKRGGGSRVFVSFVGPVHGK
jgi:hypothetical protein